MEFVNIFKLLAKELNKVQLRDPPQTLEEIRFIDNTLAVCSRM